MLVIEILEGNDRKAIEYGERAWRLSQDNPTIPANLAVAYHLLGDVNKRDEYYGHAKRLRYYNLTKLDQIFSGELQVR